MNKGISVNSEIGRLKKVLVHTPGAELENLVPNSLSELLDLDGVKITAYLVSHKPEIEVQSSLGDF